jgi:hypothetical protein
MAEMLATLGISLHLPAGVSIQLEETLKILQAGVNEAVRNEWLYIDSLMRRFAPDHTRTPEDVAKGRKAIMAIARQDVKNRLVTLIGLPIKYHVAGSLISRDVDGGPGPALKLGVVLASRLWRIEVSADALRGRWERHWI